MIDFRALLSEEKNLGKNPAAAYKADAFISIDNEISRIKDEDKMMDLREEARNLLEEDSGSIVLSYVAGRILLALRPHEYNMRLNNLLLSFYEAGNWDVVKYIGDLILSASESSKALRVLGDVADHQGEEEKKWDYYERLVKADSSDHDIIVIVADHFEKIGDRKSAMNLFLRDDKKRAYYIISIEGSAKADLKELRSLLSSRPLSFASEEDLQKLLKLSKGEVTPFGALNDEEHKVIVRISQFFKGGIIGVHPNTNTATVFLNADVLVSLLSEAGTDAGYLPI